MRYIALFSGMAADRIGFKDWECVAFAEIDPAACAVLRHHYPDIPNLGDVEKITEEQIWNLGHVDGIVFGSPCTNLSVAGNMEGLKGNESRLFYDAVRIIRYSCARFALWENVIGAFSSNGGRDFASVVGALVGMEVSIPQGGWKNAGVFHGPGLGWSNDGGAILEYRVLDALSVGGCAVHVDERGIGPVPQRRRRIFALADFGDWTCRPPILLVPESLSGHLAKGAKKRKDPAAATGSNAEGNGLQRAPSIPARTKGGGGLGTDFDLDGGLVSAIAFQERGRSGETSLDIRDDSAYCLTGKSGGGGRSQEANILAPNYAATLRSASSSSAAHGKQNGTDRETLIAVPSTGGTAHCLNAGAMGRIDYESETMIMQPVDVEPGVMAFDRAQITSAANRSTVEIGGPSPTMHDGGPPIIAFAGDKRGLGTFQNTGAGWGVSAAEDSSPSLKVGSGVGIPSAPAVSFAFKASHFTRDKDGAPSDVAPPLSADADKGDQDTLVMAPAAPWLPQGSRVQSVDLPADTLTHNPAGGTRINPVLAPTSYRIAGDGAAYPEGEGAAPLTTGTDKAASVITFEPRFTRNGRGGPQEDVMPPLKAQSGQTGKGDAAPAVAMQGLAVRRLLPVECLRLMGFPDDYFDEVLHNGKPLSDSARYKMCGNGIVTHCLLWIKRRIEWSLEIEANSVK